MAGTATRQRCPRCWTEQLWQHGRRMSIILINRRSAFKPPRPPASYPTTTTSSPPFVQAVNSGLNFSPDRDACQRYDVRLWFESDLDSLTSPQWTSSPQSLINLHMVVRWREPWRVSALNKSHASGYGRVTSQTGSANWYSSPSAAELIRARRQRLGRARFLWLQRETVHVGRVGCLDAQPSSGTQTEDR